MKPALIKMSVFLVLVFSQAAPMPVATPDPSPIVTCESDPAPEAGGVSIGTALRLHRDATVADVADECIGTVTLTPR